MARIQKFVSLATEAESLDKVIAQRPLNNGARNHLLENTLSMNSPIQYIRDLQRSCNTHIQIAEADHAWK